MQKRLRSLEQLVPFAKNINQIFTRMHAGDIEGRIVIDFQK